jgi:hypothetical protein
MSRLWLLAIFLVYLSFTVTMQYVSGAFKTGFDRHPDEPAHFVTGLMIRDYIAEGCPSAPMRFASDFYLHYPEVAFGHWPPVFYLLQAGWMLLLPPNHTSLLWLMALMTACTAWILCQTAARYFSRTLAILAGLMFIALPMTLQHASEVMLEAPLTLFGFIAGLALVSLLERCTWRSAVWFGIAASIVILTKSSGWSIALVAILAVVLSRKWKIKMLARFLLAAGIVIATCVPFYIWTRRMAFAGTEGKPMTVRHMAAGLLQSIGLLPELIGIILLLLAACGFFLKVILPWRKASVSTFWMVMAAYPIGVIVFHAIAPTIVEPRKIVMATPALLLFSFAALDWVGRKRQWLAATLAIVVLTFYTGRTIYAAPQPTDAFAEPVQALLSHLELQHELTLISSSHPGGEGAFIAEAAQREPRPIRILLRATKFLSTSTWNGLDYKLRYDTTDAVMSFLESIPVRIVVVNTSPGATYAHHDLLLRTLHQYSPDWQLIHSSHDDFEHFEIYRLTKNIPGSPGKIQIDLRDKLDTILEHQPR